MPTDPFSRGIHIPINFHKNAGVAGAIAKVFKLNRFSGDPFVDIPFTNKKEFSSALWIETKWPPTCSQNILASTHPRLMIEI